MIIIKISYEKLRFGLSYFLVLVNQSSYSHHSFMSNPIMISKETKDLIFPWKSSFSGNIPQGNSILQIKQSVETSSGEKKLSKKSNNATLKSNLKSKNWA